MQHLKYLAFVFLFLANGCVENRKLTDQAELMKLKGENFAQLDILTRDSGLYHLSYFRIEDSLLSGSGMVERNGLSSVFNGELRYGDILYIESNDVSTAQTVLALAAGAVFVGFAVATLARGSGVNVAESTYYPPSSGGFNFTPPASGCPALSSFDGKNYVFEKEAADGAFGRSLQFTTFDMMPHLQSTAGEYRLCITQPRAETDHIDELHLLVADAKPGMRIVPDEAGALHTLTNVIPPISASHSRMGDCLSKLRAEDSICWESDLQSNLLESDGDMRDEITLVFPRSSGAHMAKLLVVGGNTVLANFAEEMIVGLSGRERLRWYEAIDGDDSDAALLKSFMQREAGLHVAVYEKNGWREQGRFHDPGAANAPQIAVLDLSHVDGDSIRIRLSCASGLWKLDFTGLDFSADEPVRITELSPIRVTKNSRSEATDLLANEDGRYLDILPGDSAVVVFSAPEPVPGFQRTTIAKTSAYYHIWFRNEADVQKSVSTAAFGVPGMAAHEILPLWKKIQREQN